MSTLEALKARVAVRVDKAMVLNVRGTTRSGIGGMAWGSRRRKVKESPESSGLTGRCCYMVLNKPEVSDKNNSRPSSWCFSRCSSASDVKAQRQAEGNQSFPPTSPQDPGRCRWGDGDDESSRFNYFRPRSCCRASYKTARIDFVELLSNGTVGEESCLHAYKNGKKMER